MQLKVQAIVNGAAVDLEVDERDSALEAIRDRLGLTGTKLVCGAGVCGACTIRVDGRPIASCLMPAAALCGTAIETIERHSAGNLHSVQKAFLAHDGLQCGYCTPGFIIESIAFFERWRASNGRSSPSREAVATALAGHLCRCGAYVGIYEAVRAACAGKFDAFDANAGPAGIGATGTPEPMSYPRRDALDKVTGRARYTTDVQYEGMLTAKLVGSKHAHALVRKIDVGAAEAIPGVKAIIDVLDDPYRVVRYVGHPILAIAAIDERTALAAVAAVRIVYEVRPFVVDPIAARSADAPVVFPEKKKPALNASEGPIPPATWQGNVRTPWVNLAMSRHKRKARRTLEQARAGEAGLTRVEATYATAAQTHTALEPHACVAVWNADRLTVHASTQSVYMLGKELARHYRLAAENVVVLAEYVGGAFGAKQGMKLEHTATIDLARKARAPVRLVFDRLEEMVLGGYRPLTRIDTAIVSDRDANPLGITALAYGTSGIAVQSQNAPWFRFTYRGPKHCEDFDVTTHWSPAKPFRAPSGPSAFWALEQSVDQMAHELQIDPIALRRKWDKSSVRHRLYDWIESIPAWRNRAVQPSPSDSAAGGRFRHGVGVAIGNWFTVFNNATQIQLDATRDGLVARCALQDMGQGSRSVVAKAIADAFGVSIQSIRVEIGNSTFVPGPISSGSRTTTSIYPASIEAAERMRAQLIEKAKAGLGLNDPSWTAGGIRHEGGELPLAELLQAVGPCSVTSAKRGGNGTFDILGAMPSGDLGMSVFPKMTGAIALVSLEVDTLLGRVRPDKVWIGIAAGKIVNPELANSQVNGAVIQSLGFALTEERQYDPSTGTLLTYGLEDYRIPGIGDVPEIEIHYDESGFEKMKGGAAGLSELATLPTAAAIGNAVFNATGWRPLEAPLRPHRVLDNVRDRDDPVGDPNGSRRA